MPRRQRWRQWACLEPVLAARTFHALQRELLDTTVPADRKDDLLAALVRIARHDTDAVAAITVCLLPGLHRAARRFGASMEPDEAWAELLAGLSERIRRYPLERRPRRIAANLIWGAADRLWRAMHTQENWVSHTGPLIEGDRPSPEPELSAGTLWTLAINAGVLTRRDVTLVGATRLGGLQLRDTAQLLGVPYECAKKRRQRAEAAWVAWWAPERTGRSRDAAIASPPTRPARPATAA